MSVSSEPEGGGVTPAFCLLMVHPEWVMVQFLFHNCTSSCFERCSLNPSCRPPWGQQQGTVMFRRSGLPRRAAFPVLLCWDLMEVFHPVLVSSCLLEERWSVVEHPSPAPIQRNGKSPEATVVAKPQRSVQQRPRLQPAITVTSFWFPRLIHS